MTGHTAEEYGRLLIEYLSRQGLKVGPAIYMDPDGCKWNGEIVIAQQKLTVRLNADDSVGMKSEAYIVVDAFGRIRLRYAERIASEKEERLSECREIEILRELQEAYFWIRFQNRENEMALWFVAEREMDACSRNSAKKAAEWIFDQLLGVCREMKRTAEKLGLERIQTDRKEPCVFDGFDDMERFCQIRRIEDQITCSAKEQAELESLFKELEARETGRSEKSSSEGVIGIWMDDQRFRKEAMENLQIRIREEQEKQEALRREITDLKQDTDQ